MNKEETIELNVIQVIGICFAVDVIIGISDRQGEERRTDAMVLMRA